MSAATPSRRQVVALLILCAVGAELLAAYDDTTGDPVAIAFAVVIFGGLYGAPALLARELARRRGWGWPSLLALAFALGVAQACVIDQSLFSTDYQGFDGFAESVRATLVPGLGISAFNAYNFVIGHVVFSFCGPIAVVEAWRPETARSPWLGRLGIVVALGAYALTAGLVIADPESHSASPTQLLTSVCVIVLAVLLAHRLGRPRPTRPRPPVDAPTPRVVLATVLPIALVAGLAAETWTGLAVGLGATTIIGLLTLALARRRGWRPAHAAAVALGFLLARGLLAFTYDPLIGEVDPVAKYAHNVVMLATVAAAGLLALRGRRPWGEEVAVAGPGAS